MSIRQKHIPVTDSKLAMWRSAIALAHIDTVVSNSEIDLIHQYSAAFDFSDAQQKQLDNDMHNPQPFDALFDQVTVATDRAHLINFATVLFHIDGTYSQIEQGLFDAFHQRHLDSINIKAVLADIRDNMEQCKEAYDTQLAEHKGDMSWLERALYSLTTFWDEEE